LPARRESAGGVGVDVNAQLIAGLSKDISRCEVEIESLFDQLEHDTARADDLKKLFDERLARLELATG